MRELKFRAWSAYYKRYASEVEVYMTGGCNAIVLDDNGVPHHENTDIIFELYTGSKDKNGKEIYEGDIIDAVDLYKPADVAWHNTKAGFFVFHEADDWYFPICNLLAVEVIGNIHENPKLLEEE